MCARFAFILPATAMRQLFRTLNSVAYPPRYNIAPTQPVLCIWHDEAGRNANLARWGLVPGWVRDPGGFPLIINARAETLAQKPAFRASLAHHRCIVPASGYYEWQKGPNGEKTPFFVTNTGGSPMALAGLYATWTGPDGEQIDTTAIITVPAAPGLVHIHARAPAVLAPDQFDAWLDSGSVTATQAHTLLGPAAEGQFAFHPVSTRVNTVSNDGPGLIEPAAPDPSAPPSKKPTNGKSPQLDLF